VASGRSIARYGDGELKMAGRGVGIKMQQHHPELQRRLIEILKDSGDCLVGIPNIYSQTPKIEFWGKHASFASLLVDRPYVSSFITRADSAPWINTPEYWSLLESLWVGKDVTLVRGSGKSLTPDDLIGARNIREILTPRQHSWAEYASIVGRVGTPDHTVLICLGPAATVMAVDLCRKGVHACDLGHAALFLRKYRRGESPVVTDEDRAAV
jgi:hypothetical protein